jgi:hypothetical protein
MPLRIAELLLALALASQLVVGISYVPFFFDEYDNADCNGPKVGTIIRAGLRHVNKCIRTLSDVPAKVKGVPTSISSIRINCPSNTFSFGLMSSTCDTKRYRLKDLCLFDGSAGFKLRCIPDVCKASPNLSEYKCNARIARCAGYGYTMKW